MRLFLNNVESMIWNDLEWEKTIFWLHNLMSEFVILSFLSHFVIFFIFLFFILHGELLFL